MPNLSHINELTIPSVEQGTGIANSGIAPLHSMRIWSCGHSLRRYCSRSHLRSRCGNKTNRTTTRDDIISCQTSEDHSATTRIPFNPYLDSSVEKLEKRSTKSFEGARQLYYLESIKSVILGPSQYDSAPGQRVAT
jgi:hypothetical protein